MELVVERVSRNGVLSGNVWYNLNKYAEPVPTLNGIESGMTVEMELNKGGFINKITAKGGASVAKPSNGTSSSTSTYAAKSGRGQQTGNVLSNAVALASVHPFSISSLGDVLNVVEFYADGLNKIADRLNGVVPEKKEVQKEEVPL